MPLGRYELPALTITISTIGPDRGDRVRCGVCREPAVEHYEYSDHGGALDRCREHGGAAMRKMLTDRGHTVLDETVPSQRGEGSPPGTPR